MEIILKLKSSENNNNSIENRIIIKENANSFFKNLAKKINNGKFVIKSLVRHEL